MSKAIGVRINGIVEWHAPGVFDDYATMCGIDAVDETIGHDGTIEPSRGQKIECAQCKSIWIKTIELKLRKSDFS